MTVNGEVSIIEGNDVSLTCDYVDVFPVGNRSVFHFGETSVVLEKVILGNFSLTPTIKIVYCSFKLCLPTLSKRFRKLL